MRLLASIALAALLEGCGAGGTTTAAPPPIPTAAPSNVVPPANGQRFTLATCVPVFDESTLPVPVGDPRRGPVQVGSACGGIAPTVAPTRVITSPAQTYVLNDNHAVFCLPTGEFPVVTILAFSCNANPFK